VPRLDVPIDVDSTHENAVKLQTFERDSMADPLYGRCVLIEIPVPAGITLRLGRP